MHELVSGFVGGLSYQTCQLNLDKVVQNDLIMRSKYHSGFEFGYKIKQPSVSR